MLSWSYSILVAREGVLLSQRANSEETQTEAQSLLLLPAFPSLEHLACSF